MWASEYQSAWKKIATHLVSSYDRQNIGQHGANHSEVRKSGATRNKQDEGFRSNPWRFGADGRRNGMRQR
jgi:hypothetical protein